MRVNGRIFTERTDITGFFQIPNCPSQFRVIAENIINMITKPGYSVGDYRTMTELDKILMVDYWLEYDGLVLPTSDLDGGFKHWFIHKATAPELIRRARQWLCEHQYLFIKPDVSERAYEAGNKFSRAMAK